MKRLICLVLAVILASTAAGRLSAQGLSSGIKGGLNISKFTGNDATDSKTRSDLVAGIFVKIGLVRGVAIQPELLYSIKGDKETGAVVNKFSYIEVPMLLKYSFGTAIVPSIYAGPTLSVLLSAEREASYNGVSASVDMIQYLKSTDLGLAVGAEVMLPIRLSLEARYTVSLSSIGKAATIYGVSNAAPDMKNSTISLMVGYNIF